MTGSNTSQDLHPDAGSVQTMPAPTQLDAAALLARMRAGDREAVSEFITHFGELIKRRVRGKLGKGMRRIFDSQEILSTVSRRLDQYVCKGKLQAQDQPQLWSLLTRMIDAALVDKIRVYKRLHAVEQEDSDFARRLLVRMRDGEARSPDGAELELSSAFQCLQSDVDREVLALWLNDVPHTQIAEQLDCTPAAIRQRWQSIRNRLKEQLLSRST